jgi:hypothetical protein
MNDQNIFGRLMAIIASGAAVVSATFTLFGSVLSELLPYVEGAGEAVKFFSFGTLVILLALTIFIRKRIKVVAQWIWASIGLALLTAAAFLYFSFSDLVRTNTFRYPPEAAEERQVVVIGGEIHPEGRAIVGERPMSSVVAELGGPGLVMKHSLLWTERARKEMIGRFVRYYAAITFLMTSALFIVVITVWRGLPTKSDGTRSRHRLPDKESADST